MMLDAISDRVTELADHPKPTDEEVWGKWAQQLFALPDNPTPQMFAQHRQEYERLVKWGYKLILLERDPYTDRIAKEMPASEEEFDALPDALDELRKRLQAG